MEKYLLVKSGDRLIGATDEDANFVLSLADGEMVTCTPDDARALWRHRKFFALLKAVLNHMPEELTQRYPTTASLLIELKIRLGMIDLHTDVTGREVWITTNSISFARMGERKFKEFVNECKVAILQHFLVGMTPEDFDENLYKLYFD